MTEQLHLTNYETLTQVSKLHRQWQRLDERAKVLKSRAEYPSGSGESIGSHPATSDNRIEILFAQVAEAEREAREAQGKYNAARADALRVIDTLDDLNQAMVLRLRYIDEMSLIEISKILHYHERTVYKIKNKALKKLKVGR